MTMAEKRTLRDQALSIRKWADRRGLLHAGSYVGGAIYAGPIEAEPFSATAAETFVRKPITAVGINSARGPKGSIVVYTARPLTAKERDELQEDFKGDRDLDFQVARPLILDPTVLPAITMSKEDLGRGGRYTCGRSISIGNVREAGTLGALLADNAGSIFGLSANHVTGGCSSARPGAPIVAPGILDVGAGNLDPRTIGHHFKALPLVPGDPSAVAVEKNRDAAVFQILNDRTVSSMQGSAYDTPSSVGDPREEAQVEKFGRTTSLTRGIVESEIVGPHPVTYKSTAYHSAEESVDFRGLVYFQPVFVVRGTSGPFAMTGDSGALVTSSQAGKRTAVGLVFSGRGADESYILPIKPILGDLGMKLVTGHGT
jgi:hypothetical protein